MQLQKPGQVTLSSIYPRMADKIAARNKAREKYNEMRPYVPALEYCRALPARTKKEFMLKQEVMSCYPDCCFNHRIGMPRLTYEDETRGVYWESDPIEFSEYATEVIIEYENGNFYAILKCRGAGISEVLTVRHMLYKYAVANTTKERKCLICGSISLTISKNFTHRIKVLLDRVPFLYQFGMKPNTDFPKEIFCRSGGQIIAVPAEEDAFRSYDKVGDVILEESTAWEKEDDVGVVMAAEPHVFKSGAKIGNVFTPKGKRGYVWTKIFNDDPEFKTKYKKHILNWRRVCCMPEPNVVQQLDGNENPIPFEKVSFAEHWLGKDQKEIEKYYRAKYKKDPRYKAWFDSFFKVSIDAFFNFSRPIISISEIIRLYKEDRETYDQEADNKFLTTGQVALGSDFIEVDGNPTDFAKILKKAKFDSEVGIPDEEAEEEDEDNLF